VPEAVDASGAEAAAKGVERQFAVELDAPVLDEIERFALLAEAVGFETVDDGMSQVPSQKRGVDR